MQCNMPAVNGSGEQASAVEEPAATTAIVETVKLEESPLPPLPETDANELKEEDAEEDIDEEGHHGIHLKGILRLVFRDLLCRPGRVTLGKDALNYSEISFQPRLAKDDNQNPAGMFVTGLSC